MSYTITAPRQGNTEMDVSTRLESELSLRIDTLTQRQIRDLHVVHEHRRVILNGCSRSYYVKQLASQAVIDLLPEAELDNSIDVLA